MHTHSLPLASFGYVPGLKMYNLYSLKGKVSGHDNHRLLLYHNNGYLEYDSILVYVQVRGVCYYI